MRGAGWRADTFDSMRSFVDDRGQSWQAVVGKESYGTLVLLFSAEGGGEMRRLVLAAASRLEAESRLVHSSDDELRAWLRDADPAD